MYGPSDPGGGPPVQGLKTPDGTPLEDLGLGVRDWYDEDRAGGPLPDLSWAAILTAWEALEGDFQKLYGIDLDDGILSRRSWRWFRVRTIRLLADKTSLATALGLIQSPDRVGG